MPLEGSKQRIGVLALQGAFAAHRRMLQKLAVASIEVRTKEQLSLCDGLILPGGESTAIFHLLSSNRLLEPLLSFAEKRPIFGTCAGLIIMEKLKLLNIEVARNSYGRQTASFTAPITLWSGDSFPGIFIRAPRISTLCSKEILVLGRREEEVVFIQQRHHLAATFHPELTEELSLHRHFAKLCQYNSSLV